MKHVRIISLSALLAACSSIPAMGVDNSAPDDLDKSSPGDSLDGGKQAEEGPTSLDGGAQVDELLPPLTDAQVAAGEQVPESIMVSSAEELEELIAAAGSDGLPIGGLALRMIDAPVEAEAVNVTICGVQVQLRSEEERAPGMQPPVQAGDAAVPTREDRGEPTAPREPSASTNEMPPPERLPDGEMLPPKDEMPLPEKGEEVRPPEDNMPPPAEEMRLPEDKLPPPDEMLKPEEMRPAGEVPSEPRVPTMEFEGADGGIVRPKPPEPKPGVGAETGELPPPPPDRPAMMDAGTPPVREPVPGDMRPPQGDEGVMPVGHWLGVSDTCVSVDLLQLQGGVFEELGFAALPIGDYGQVRLVLTDMAIVVDGESHPLRIPSGSESGLKITGGFAVASGEITTLTVDFDAAQSVEQAADGEYILKPVVVLAGEERHRAIRPGDPGTSPDMPPRADVPPPEATQPDRVGEETKPTTPTDDGMRPVDDRPADKPEPKPGEETLPVDQKPEPPRDAPPVPTASGEVSAPDERPAPIKPEPVPTVPKEGELPPPDAVPPTPPPPAASGDTKPPEPKP